MRARPLYFAFWFPITVVCTLAAGSFVHILANTPRYPREGMEALAGLPILLALAAHLPFLVGFALCLIFRPRVASLRLSVVVPTVLLSGGTAAAVAVIPRTLERTYDVALEFVDPQGQPPPELTIRYTLETPQFMRLKEHRPPAPTTIVVRDGHLTITKKRQEQLKLEIEAPGFYYLGINIGQWVYDVPDYIHKVDFWWRRDKTYQTRDNSLSSSLNWRPDHDRILRVVVLRHGDELRSLYPPYTEESIRELDANKKD